MPLLDTIRTTVPARRKRRPCALETALQRTGVVDTGPGRRFQGSGRRDTRLRGCPSGLAASLLYAAALKRPTDLICERRDGQAPNGHGVQYSGEHHGVPAGGFPIWPACLRGLPLFLMERGLLMPQDAEYDFIGELARISRGTLRTTLR
jgi:hypothetical protein